MALRGTLKDFGIADILQLIGQQQKTGVLLLKARDEEVRVTFKDGNVVRAESATRKKKELLGDMLVRAEIITQQQLEAALDEQRRTLRRLGDLLVSQAAMAQERMREMVYLQTTETLYRLFTWKAGTYEFDAGEVEADPEAPNIRSESVLMEGFRRVDEWPMIRKRIANSAVKLQKLAPLPAVAGAVPEGDVDAALNGAFGGGGAASGAATSVGINDRRIYALVEPGRTVQKIVDLSRLGEFETCKALFNLVNGGYLKPLAADRPGAEDELGGFARVGAAARALGVLFRIAVTLVIIAMALAALLTFRLDGLTVAKAGARRFADPATQRFLARTQLARLQAALAIYEVEKGEVPERLAALVETGIVAEEDLKYPWTDTYYYRKVGRAGYVLLPPLR